jgi:outer membrane beta-barrel protein
MNRTERPLPHTRTGPSWRLLALIAALVAVPPAAAQTPDSTASSPPSAPGTEAAPSPIASPSDSTAAAMPAPPAERVGAAPNRPLTAITRRVRLIAEGRNVVRSGPGERYSIAGVFDKGAVFPVIAKSDLWYNVRLSETETGWVHSHLCQELDDMADFEFKPNPKLYTRTGSYVLSGYTGAYAFDRKSNSLVLGARLGYYIFDRVQAEAGLAWTHINRPAEIVETLFGLTLEAEQFHMLFYQLNMTWEVLPGRQMVPFVTGGVGSSIMQGETEASINFGAGTALFLSKRLATRWEVRDYRFRTGAGTSRVTNDNIEFTLGTSYLF